MMRRSTRPRWPACAIRYTSPWRRKMSATSNAGMTAAIRPGRLPPASADRTGWPCCQWSWRRPAYSGLSSTGRDDREAPRPSPGQALDNADVGAGFEQMSSEAVAQRVDGDRLVELGCRTRDAAGGLQYAWIKRPAVILAGKQPMRRPCFPPVCAQHDEELRRQHDVAVAAALALVDPDQHATTVDVGEFQAHHFRYAQPSGIGGHQRGAVLEVRHGREKPHDLLGGQDYGQLPALACIGNALDHRGAAECDAVEEAQGEDRDVEAGPRDAGRVEVDLIGADFLQPEPVGRPVEVPGEFADRMHVATLRHRRQVSHLHVLDHATAQWVHFGHWATS